MLFIFEIYSRKAAQKGRLIAWPFAPLAPFCG
jgi:hypothetical protein